MLRFFSSVREDIAAVFERDPAARSRCEVFLCYPGLHALWAYRLAHWLWLKKLYFVARLLSQFARFATGIEIHPGSQIGRRLFIDHGMAVIIGETAVLGDDVTMYQGVTLGGTGKEKGKRHPTIADGVVIGAGAKVLGNICVGKDSRIGAGSVVLRDIPENSTVVGVPGHIVYKNAKRVVVTDPKDVHDPVLEIINSLTCRLQELERQVSSLKISNGQSGRAPCASHLPGNVESMYLISPAGAMTNIDDSSNHRPWIHQNRDSSLVREVERAEAQ